MEDVITIKLTGYEALILFEAISKICSTNNLMSDLDETEQQMVFDLESSLERELAEIFDADYDAVIAEAKTRLRER